VSVTERRCFIFSRSPTVRVRVRVHELYMYFREIYTYHTVRVLICTVVSSCSKAATTERGTDSGASLRPVRLGEFAMVRISVLNDTLKVRCPPVFDF